MSAIMEEILRHYKERKFQKSLELVNSLKESNDDIENILLDNCRLVCQSYIRIDENDSEKILEMLEEHYLFFEKVTSIGINCSSVPVQLKLVATYNFTYWLLFFTDVDQGTSEADKYLEIINKGLLSVLGNQTVTTLDLCERVLSNLMALKDSIIVEEYKTALLILELVIVIILYVLKLKTSLVKDCLKVVSFFVEQCKLVSPNELLQVKSISPDLFKLTLFKSGTLLSELKSSIIDAFYLSESAFLFLLEDFKGSLRSLQKNMHTSLNSLWHYLVILNSYELGNWNLCSKFLIKMSSSAVHNSLRARFRIMQGKLNSIERKHKESLRHFEEALSLSPDCPIIYYYIGQEYGKMGLIDAMVENFEKLVQVMQIGLDDVGEDFQPNFENTLLEWIHPTDEISKAEAHYALAVSYGLNENFKKADETFEKVLQYLDGENMSSRKRIVELPNYLTILHEASVMNLMLGNLVRAEQISLDAIDQYVVQKSPETRHNRVPLLNKDAEWLERVIQRELLDAESEPKELSDELIYAEDLLLFFPRNVIALLILSEVQRIQELEDYKTTLSDVFSIFAKYLTLMKTKEELNEDEKHALTLVKALAGKTCVRIASFQISRTNDLNVEKMLKRALSCNKGDRDALYNYYKFLLKAGRRREALKLWNTFYKEKATIGLDSLQSFSLKYFLTDKITNRELEKIQREIEAGDVTFS